ncbi:MAG: FtsQ-type POTRA domain-containing protein [Gemmatimonadetes bacterium]|nr:FtsQ-type POTRA domain-containing protein [Gemmatimonadota bacterium]
MSLGRLKGSGRRRGTGGRFALRFRWEWLSRRDKRQALAIAGAAALGILIPVLLPSLFSALPAFQIRNVTVTGAYYLPDAVVERAARLPAGASVWHDPRPWEANLVEHPMIASGEIRRIGSDAIEIVVSEKVPVALVATPELKPVDRGGEFLDLVPASVALDLPVIGAVAELDSAAVVGAANALGRIGRIHPGFIALVSEVTLAPGGYRLAMLEGAGATEIFLPADDPVDGLRRVSLALGQIPGSNAERVDARFDDQVVLAGEFKSLRDSAEARE